MRLQVSSSLETATEAGAILLAAYKGGKELSVFKGAGRIDGTLLPREAVKSDLLASRFVKASLISAQNVIGEHLKSQIVTGEKLSVETVRSEHIAAKSVRAQHITTGVLLSSEAQIADALLKTAHFQNNSISESTIGNLELDEGKFLRANIDGIKFANDVRFTQGRFIETNEKTGWDMSQVEYFERSHELPRAELALPNKLRKGVNRWQGAEAVAKWNAAGWFGKLVTPAYNRPPLVPLEPPILDWKGRPMLTWYQKMSNIGGVLKFEQGGHVVPSMVPLEFEQENWSICPETYWVTLEKTTITTKNKETAILQGAIIFRHIESVIEQLQPLKRYSMLFNLPPKTLYKVEQAIVARMSFWVGGVLKHTTQISRLFSSQKITRSIMLAAQTTYEIRLEVARSSIPGINPNTNWGYPIDPWGSNIFSHQGQSIVGVPASGIAKDKAVHMNLGMHSGSGVLVARLVYADVPPLFMIPLISSASLYPYFIKGNSSEYYRTQSIYPAARTFHILLDPIFYFFPPLQVQSSLLILTSASQ